MQSNILIGLLGFLAAIYTAVTVLLKSILPELDKKAPDATWTKKFVFASTGASFIASIVGLLLLFSALPIWPQPLGIEIIPDKTVLIISALALLVAAISPLVAGVFASAIIYLNVGSHPPSD